MLSVAKDLMPVASGDEVLRYAQDDSEHSYPTRLLKVLALRPVLKARLVGKDLQESGEVGVGPGAFAVGGELGGRDVDHLHDMPAALPIGHLLGFAEVPFLVGAGRVMLHDPLESLMVRRGPDSCKILNRHRVIP